MINLLKDLINNNEEVKELLQNCSDDFLLNNKSIILSALDQKNIKKGYKIKLIIIDDILEWEYVPCDKDTIKNEKMFSISKQYKYKLPLDWSNYYLLNPNDIKWTNGKKILLSEFKRIIKDIDNGKITKGYWVWGISDSGKTYSSISLLNFLAKKGKTVSFVNIHDLVLSKQDAINNYESNLDIEKIKKSDIIVIDDIGSERPTPWVKENILIPIIDYRLKSNKTTIFTSNFNIEKYKNKLNGRSQNFELEEETNLKIISRIKKLINFELRID